jgi:hypothetical protein
MASTSTPYGFVPISHQSGTPRTLRIPNGIHTGLASNIYKYQPVFIDTTYGTITPVTATTDKIFGIFAGVEYTPTGQRPVVSPFWPSGTTYDSTGDMFVYVWPAWDASLRFQVQADGTVAQALLGSQFNIANPGNGNTTTGLSAAGVLHAGVAGSSQGQFFLEEFFTGVNDSIGDAYTDLIVGVAYPQVGPGYQTSIG